MTDIYDHEERERKWLVEMQLPFDALYAAEDDPDKLLSSALEMLTDDASPAFRGIQLALVAIIRKLQTLQ